MHMICVKPTNQCTITILKNLKQRTALNMANFRAELNSLKQDYLLCLERGKYQSREDRRKAEVVILNKLADYYAQEARKDPLGNWTQLLKAHALYNSCRVRVKKSSQADFYAEKVRQLENLYQETAKLPPIPDLVKRGHKDLVERIRFQSREAIKPLRKMVTASRGPGVAELNWRKIDSICVLMESVARKTNEWMLNFAKRIISDSVEYMGRQLPCSLAVVAKGSLARGEATPYSDLEFFFIIGQKTPETKEYFTHLAMTTYFMIGNLQETKLKYMNIRELRDWFDDQETSGVKIDGLKVGAGNIPTGNGTTDRKNKYIYELQELVDKYRQILDNPDEEEAIQGDDSAMMAFMKEIYSFNQEGSGLRGSLLDEFMAQKRAMKMNQERRRITQQMLRNDVEQYQLNMTEFLTEDGTIDVKQKIYRLPSLLILDLCILYEVDALSSWDGLYQLQQLGKISCSIQKALRNLLSMASYVRMCTYLYHKSQKEAMVLRPRKKKTGPAYLVSLRFFKAIIVYMASIEGKILPPENLSSTEVRLHEQKGVDAVSDLYQLF